MRREVIDKLILTSACVVELCGFIASMCISWQATLLYFTTCVAGALLMNWYKDRTTTSIPQNACACKCVLEDVPVAESKPVEQIPQNNVTVEKPEVTVTTKPKKQVKKKNKKQPVKQ